MRLDFKLAGILFLLGIFLLAFGCASSVSDKTAFDELSSLKEKFGAVNSFPTNKIAQNDYISQLAVLRGKASGSAAKVIDAELFSIQAFYYLNDALFSSSLINYEVLSCSSKEVKKTVFSIALAKDYYNKAIVAINALSSDESKYLRSNQLEAVKDYGVLIEQLEKFFNDKC